MCVCVCYKTNCKRQKITLANLFTNVPLILPSSCSFKQTKIRLMQKSIKKLALENFVYYKTHNTD